MHVWPSAWPKPLLNLMGSFLNYMKVERIIKNEEGIVQGVIALDLETHKKYHIQSKVVINATGVFADAVIKMDDPSAKEMIQPSQGDTYCP